MMRVTFLGHSGFLVETETTLLLFDWHKGDLPALPDKPLLVFASHQHKDHFNPRIFALDDGSREVQFFLGHDLVLTEHRKQRWNISSEMEERCHVMNGGETASVFGVAIETLTSTDEGVAFLVTCDGKAVYHAGDLNWWHWEGEDPLWNENMAADFKRYIEPLRDRTIDLAFAPLDPRQEDAADWGFLYLLKLADVRRIVPMHQWEDPTPTRLFCAVHTHLACKVVPMEAPGQTIVF